MQAGKFTYPNTMLTWTYTYKHTCTYTDAHVRLHVFSHIDMEDGTANCSKKHKIKLDSCACRQAQPVDTYTCMPTCSHLQMCMFNSASASAFARSFKVSLFTWSFHLPCCFCTGTDSLDLIPAF